MIKVLFLIHDLGQGGAEKVLVNLVNNMDESKFDITLISLFGGGVNEQFLKENIHYKTIFKNNIPGNSKLMKLLSAERLHELFIKDTYDIEIAYLEGPVARIVSGCRNTKTKLVSWIHVEQHSKKLLRNHFGHTKSLLSVINDLIRSFVCQNQLRKICLNYIRCYHQWMFYTIQMIQIVSLL